MKIYHIQRIQTFPITLEEAWAFFSSPDNLSKITPAQMNIKIIYISGGAKAYAGQIIRYKITVLPMVRLSWVTEITHVDSPQMFVDEQRFGPYAFWHHQHHFKETPAGIEMTDDLHYALPMGVLGRLAHWLFVGKEVNGIFEYRQKTLATYFRKK